MTIPQFYRDKRVLVTGLTGFKGRWLGTWLDQLGAEVQGLALPLDNEDVSLQAWPSLPPCAFGDVRDFLFVSEQVRRFQPEIVFHLAAQPLVRRSYLEPVDTFATNVMGTVHLLEAIRHSPSVRAVIVVTSDKCYENREWLWSYREIDALGGHDPYSASKGCAEIVTGAYRRSFGHEKLGVASARAGNVIGGGDWATDRLVPDLVRALHDETPVVLRRPGAVRPWQHVLEPLCGYLLLGQVLYAEPERFGSAWNFGPDESDTISVRELVQQFFANWGRGAFQVDCAGGPHEALCLRLDSSKARSELNWSGLLKNVERVAWTVEWYQRFRQDSRTVMETTQRQIALFEEKISQCPLLAQRWFAASAGSSVRPSHAA